MSHRIGRPSNGFPSLPVVNLDGVEIGKHALTQDAELLASVTRRIGKRLAYWLRRTGHGIPALEQPMPSPEFLEAFRYYQSAQLGILREQRERFALLKGEEVDEATLKAQFRASLVDALSTFSAEERAFAMKLWDAKTAQAIPTTGTETKEPQ